MRERIYGRSRTQTGASMKELADFYRDSGNFAASESRYKEILSMIRNEFDDQHPLKRPARQSLARLYIQIGDYHKAEPLLAEALSLLESVFHSNHRHVITARRELGECRLHLGKYAAAESLLTNSYRTLEAQRGLKHQATQHTLERLIELYDGWGKPEMADAYRARQDLLIED